MKYGYSTFLITILALILTQGYRYVDIQPLRSTPGIYYEYIKTLQTIDNMIRFSLRINLTAISHNTSVLRNSINNIHECSDPQINCKALITRNEYLLHLLTYTDELLNDIYTLSSKSKPLKYLPLYPRTITHSSYHDAHDSTSIVLSFSEFSSLQHNLQGLFDEVLTEEHYLSRTSPIQDNSHYSKVQSWTTTLEAYLLTQISTYKLLLQLIDDAIQNNLAPQLHLHLKRSYNVRMNPTTELCIDQRFSRVRLLGKPPFLTIGIELPTINKVVYEVYKIYSIPALQSNHRFASVILNQNYIMINKGGHALIDSDQLSECSSNTQRFLCSRGFSISQERRCESEMLIRPSNSSAALCNITVQELINPHWTFLTHSTLWLFTAKEPTLLHIQCYGTTESILLQNYGLLNLRSGCSAFTDKISISSTNAPTINEILIYAPNFNLTINTNIENSGLSAFFSDMPIIEVLSSTTALTYINCIALLIISILYYSTKCKHPVEVTVPTPYVQPSAQQVPFTQEPYYETPRTINPTIPLLRNFPSPTYANL